jgi:hypothetical protein
MNYFYEGDAQENQEEDNEMDSEAGDYKLNKYEKVDDLEGLSSSEEEFDEEGFQGFDNQGRAEGGGRVLEETKDGPEREDEE